MTEFFYEPVTGDRTRALELARAIIETCRRLPPETALLISEPPLATKIAEIPAERLLDRISPEKLPLIRGIVALMNDLGPEVRPGNYFVETFLDEIAKLPSFTSGGSYQFSLFHALRQKGCRFSDLAENFPEAREVMIRLSREVGVSFEYLLGNLDKAAGLLKLLGVRETTLNLSNLFYNFESGLIPFDLSGSRPIDSSEILKRSRALESQGVAIEVFRSGDFNVKVTGIGEDGLEEVILDLEMETEEDSDRFRKFFDAVLRREEERLQRSPALSIRRLLACFPFSTAERPLVSLPAVTQQDDPLRWKQTEVGRAVVPLRPALNWLAFSTGVKAAGDLPALQKNEPALRPILERIRQIRELTEGFPITLTSGRTGKWAEFQLSEMKPEEILFDLYCLAVLEKRSLGEVVETAVGILQLIPKLENREPIVNLNPLLSARLAGEPYVTLLGTQGLVLRNAPMVAALEKLRGLEDRVRFTIRSPEGTLVPIPGIAIEDFRRAIILLGRRFSTPHSPERILGVINDKIAPEIFFLPKAVIDPGPHDLGRIVELALAGVPPRYPLRRPWRRLDLDPWVGIGNCLEPGVRNCLGCPVNTLYGLVMKTALGLGFEEIITYEATGCFEVYTGIWPYTGKIFPSLHGVFGGVPSEMLGGLAAKKARLKHALKTGGVGKERRRILHLGWGGDGATFDIGFGNLSGLFSRLQKITPDDLEGLLQRALYVCYDNEGYQNTGNQYSGASPPGGDTTTNPKGKMKPLGSDLRKKPIVEIVADHGVSFSARLNIHRQEHIARVVARALEDGTRGSFVHFLQPCTTGWKFAADSLTYELSSLAEGGGLFPPVTIEHGVPYLEMYPTPRNPGDAFLKLQARFKHLLGNAAGTSGNLEKVTAYYREEWLRNLRLTGFEGEISQADRLGYLEEEHRSSRIS